MLAKRLNTKIFAVECIFLVNLNTDICYPLFHKRKIIFFPRNFTNFAMLSFFLFSSQFRVMFPVDLVQATKAKLMASLRAVSWLVQGRKVY